ncbi:DNA adenine methylase [Rhodothalassium salexigens DSM 2132]|uniref:DNA adenine methylase n=1 Tax=Rhodothalassium salexigens DSM 2132 TaxID=1188247 RepID=A0A4R2P661_RHOSA|nr:DNA adenine methylase [Rhodothalassium salexigens]MBB4212789.1 DNA adenine methylase [Rhodothalassium salexigens DSM 2132]MBK1640265.1 DNA methyltransferase [Rhodothalassium salexigens DSM 2132]TCP29708.1 DNA adenine methylase [Rhodothalassium salexigens DSM 2132]
MINPVLRWHGGKARLAPWIISHFPAHRVYVEPYGGAGSVLLSKPRAYAEVYNDLDGDVVTLFHILRTPGAAERLEEALRLTPFARTEYLAAYEPCGDPVERARRLIVRSMMGHGSNSPHSITGFRADTRRDGGTPVRDWARYPDRLPEIVDRLRGVVIENRPAIAVMGAHDGEQTLHYVDPPYVPSTRGRGRDYAFEMTEEDHADLADCLHRLRGMVVVSGYPSPLYERLYPKWERVERRAYADGARQRVECLWLNPAACHRRPTADLFCQTDDGECVA